MQSNGNRRGRKLVACLFHDNRVVIHDLETRAQTIVKVNDPWMCPTAHRLLAVTTCDDSVRLFSIDGDLDHIVSDSTNACSAAFHPRNTNIIAIGYNDGTVRMWDVSTQAYVSSFKEHTNLITNIRFAPDGRLLLSSGDNAASIVTLADQFQTTAYVILEGHMHEVNDILPLLSSNQCVTCSNDKTIKVWDCQTGECLRTLTEHRHPVLALAMNLNGYYFASGSDHGAVIIWSCETFEILRRIQFPEEVATLVFGNSDALYAGVYNRGVMSCNALTCEIGTAIIPGIGNIPGLALGNCSSFVVCICLFLTSVIIPQYLHPSPGLP